MTSPPPVVFEDDVLIVLSKPAGWVVNRVESTTAPMIQDFVRDYLKNNSSSSDQSVFSTRDGVVHRLDKETSGLLLVAKTAAAFKILSDQFAQRQVKKSYQALVHGRMDNAGQIDAPVGRLPWNRQRFGVLSQGRQSATAFKRLALYRLTDDARAALAKVAKQKNILPEVFSLLDLNPTTGRTHQIRVHLKSLNHPIVADSFYAGRKTSRLDRLWCPRLFLHAQYLGFYHPTTSHWLDFTLPLPQDLQDVLNHLSGA